MSRSSITGLFPFRPIQPWLRQFGRLEGDGGHGIMGVIVWHVGVLLPVAGISQVRSLAEVERGQRSLG